jgi:hypothetical protein
MMFQVLERLEELREALLNDGDPRFTHPDGQAAGVSADQCLQVRHVEVPLGEVLLDGDLRTPEEIPLADQLVRRGESQPIPKRKGRMGRVVGWLRVGLGGG